MPFQRTLGRLREHRRLWLSVFDLTSWVVALVLAYMARMDFRGDLVEWGQAAVAWFVVATIHLTIGWMVKLHHGRAALATLEELMLLGGVTISAGVLLTCINLVMSPHLVPRSVPLIATFMAATLMGGGRAIWRRTGEAERRSRLNAVDAEPVIIFGAGDGGRQFIRSIRTLSSGRRWSPVALLDDDVSKRHLRIYGVPVLGTSADIAAVSQQTGATLVVVAIPSADAGLIRRVSDSADDAGVKVKLVPGLTELLHDRVAIEDLRDINLSDVLGRRQVKTDLSSIAGYLTGRRVLVTGAGGSIGAELCRQIHQWKPAELIMFDRDESALHAVQLSIHGRALLDSPEVVLGDIRDTSFVNALWNERRPHVVFHAAALKHLPLLEQYPGEAIKTNVWGTLTVLEASKASGVERFVNISTDKAANPCSVLGYSKRIAEGLTAAVGGDTLACFLSVRFGNVLGSRGSVLETFASQISTDRELTVTHPDITRYFMTIQEAVELVIQAAAIGRKGEALVLDMGKPVRINDVALKLIRLSGKALGIEYTGVRPGEKMHEDLFGEGEPDVRPVHPLISHAPVPAVDPADARILDPGDERETILAVLDKLCMNMGPTRSAMSPAIAAGSE